MSSVSLVNIYFNNSAIEPELQSNSINNKTKILDDLDGSKFLIKDSLKLNDDLFKNGSSKTLFYGTGLCTTKEISDGLPFDFISMLTTAEKIRRAIGLEKIIHLIADSHAKTNPFVSSLEADFKAQEQKIMIERACRNLKIDGHYKVILASEFDDSKEYKEIFSSISANVHDYVKKEWTDIEYLRKYHELGLKLSWKIEDKKNRHKFDEQFFDDGYSKEFGPKLSFAYLSAGRTFDPKRQNVCPYTAVKGEKRILIRKEECAEQKLKEYINPKETATVRAADYLSRIVDDFEDLFGTEVTQGEASKIDAIIQKVFFKDSSDSL